MTGRTGELLLTAGGVVLVVVLALKGTDLQRAARVGPRWRRRLVAAGITLLTATGLLSCGEPPATPRNGVMSGDLPDAHPTDTRSTQKCEPDTKQARPIWVPLVHQKEYFDSSFRSFNSSCYDGGVVSGKSKVLPEVRVELQRRYCADGTIAPATAKVLRAADKK